MLDISPSLPSFVSGPRQFPSAEDLNSMSHSIDSLMRSRLANGLTSSTLGLMTVDPAAESFWVRVTAIGVGTPPPHAFVQVIERNQSPGLFDDLDDSIQGDLDISPLYEANGNTLAVNTYVRAIKGVGDYYLCVSSDPGMLVTLDVMLSDCSNGGDSRKIMKQTIRIPSAWLVGDSFCVIDPTDCCPGSGSGETTACCPDTVISDMLCLTISNSTCACINGSYALTFTGVWWEALSVSIPECDGGAIGLILECKNGTWVLSLICGPGGDQNIINTSNPAVIHCSPFSLSATGVTAFSCCTFGGSLTFDWFVAEGDCSGSGGGDRPIVTECCPGGLPLNLYVTFEGALAGLGTVIITWSGTDWEAGGFVACGSTIAAVRFICNGDETWTLTVTDSVPETVWTASGAASSCTPLSWSKTAIMAFDLTSCPIGSATVTVSETP